jgi:hypothetical protein
MILGPFAGLALFRPIRSISGRRLQRFRRWVTAAKDAVPDVEKALAGSQDPVVRATLAQVLATNNDRKACEPLAQAIRRENPDNDFTINQTRDIAASSLVDSYPLCPDTVQLLTNLLGKGLYPPGMAGPLEDLARLGAPAVGALAIASRSRDLDVRKDAVSVLASMKPLPAGAEDALLLAMKDKNREIRDDAALVIRDRGGADSGAAAALLQRDIQQDDQGPTLDPKPYTKTQIVADIPSDNDHKHPMSLVYPLFSIRDDDSKSEDSPFLVAVYAGKERPQRVVFWKKTVSHHYVQEQLLEGGSDDDSYQQPFTFTSDGQLFIDVPVEGWRYTDDNVFAVEAGGLCSAKVEDASDWCDKKGLFGPGQYTSPRYIGNSFSNEKLEFSFAVLNPDDPMCCPSAGEIDGTYKAVSEYVPNDPQHRQWKFVVTSATLSKAGARH